jgi:hypothetical protein
VEVYCEWWQQGHNVEVRVLGFEVVTVRSYSHISDHRSFGGGGKSAVGDGMVMQRGDGWGQRGSLLGRRRRRGRATNRRRKRRGGDAESPVVARA